MAGINTSIQITDRVTGSLNRIVAALYNTTSAFEGVDNAADGFFNSSGADAMVNELYEYEDTIQRLEKDLNDANNKLEEMENNTKKVSNAGTSLGGAFGKVAGLLATLGIASAVKEQVAQAIDYASDLTEVQNVVDVAFGDSAKIVDEWATTTLESFGLNKLSAKQFAGTMGAMLKSSGMTGDSVAEMSMRITELSGDMASFYNLSGEEAFNKIRSGISGETEPLKQLGIDMSVANLEAYALSQGIKEAYSEMSQAEQVTLRYNYLLQTTQDAQGDFARTSDSFANQIKLLNENWKEFTGELAMGVLPVLSAGIGMLNSLLGFLAENWSILSPILWGVAAALALVNAPLVAQAGLWLWNSVLVPAYTAVIGFLQHGYKVLTDATYRNSAAQLMYNNALLASPLTWILLIIIAVVAAVYAVIAVINKVTGSTISATGVIVGALMVAVAFIWNLFLGLVDLVLACVNALVNPWISFANFFGNLFNDPIGSIIHLFGDMADNILGILESIAKAMDKLFGTDMAGAVSGWRGSLDAKIETAANKYGNGSYEKIANELNLSSESLGLKRWAYSDAYNLGESWGKKIDAKVSNMFSSGNEDEEQDSSNIADIAKNTDSIADSVEISSENLKYIRDIAEREVVNRFTTAEIKVDMGGITNKVTNNTDLDGMVRHLTATLEEEMAACAEGVVA